MTQVERPERAGIARRKPEHGSLCLLPHERAAVAPRTHVGIHETRVRYRVEPFRLLLFFHDPSASERVLELARKFERLALLGRHVHARAARLPAPVAALVLRNLGGVQRREFILVRTARKRASEEDAG